MPGPINPTSGCRFHPRRPLATDICKHKDPGLLELDGHVVRCHAVEQEVNAVKLNAPTPG